MEYSWKVCRSSINVNSKCIKYVFNIVNWLYTYYYQSDNRVLKWNNEDMCYNKLFISKGLWRLLSFIKITNRTKLGHYLKIESTRLPFRPGKGLVCIVHTWLPTWESNLTPSVSWSNVQYFDRWVSFNLRLFSGKIVNEITGQFNELISCVNSRKH